MAKIAGTSLQFGADSGSPSQELGNTAYRTSFSGADIVAVIGPEVIGEISGLTASIQREKVPTYVMGDPNPQSYSRGKRGIAGAMTFVVWDRSALMRLVNSPLGTYVGKLHEVRNVQLLSSDNVGAPNVNFSTAGAEELKFELTSTNGSGGGTLTSGQHALIKAFYADQIMPFNVIVIGANEYGGGSVMSIRSAEITASNTSVSIDDIQTEESMTYVARHIIGWQPMRPEGLSGGPNVTTDQISGLGLNLTNT